MAVERVFSIFRGRLAQLSWSAKSHSLQPKKLAKSMRRMHAWHTRPSSTSLLTQSAIRSCWWLKWRLVLSSTSTNGDDWRRNIFRIINSFRFSFHIFAIPNLFTYVLHNMNVVYNHTTCRYKYILHIHKQPVYHILGSS